MTQEGFDNRRDLRDHGSCGLPVLRLISGRAAVAGFVAAALIVLTAPPANAAETPPPLGPAATLLLDAAAPSAASRAVEQLPEDPLAGLLDGLEIPTVKSITDLVKNPPSLQFRFITDCGQGERVHPAVFNVPTPLNVDGLPDAEYLGTVTAVSEDAGTLRIEKVDTTAPRCLVAAEVLDPSTGSRKARVGYDGRLADKSPLDFTAALRIDRSGGTITGGTIAWSVVDPLAPPPNKLAIVFNAFFRSIDGKTEIRVARSTITYGPPMPSSGQISVSSTASAKTATLSSAQPTLVRVQVEDDPTGPGIESSVDTSILKLPTSLTLRAEENLTSGERRISYAASAPVGSVNIRGQRFSGGTQTRNDVLTLTSLPTHINILQRGALLQMDTKNPATELGTGVVGVIDATFVTGATAPTLPPELGSRQSFVHFVDAAPLRSVRARLLGLTSASAVLGDSISLDAELTPASFGAVIQRGARRFNIGVSNLPSKVRFLFGTLFGAGVVEYGPSSAPINTLTVGAIDPAGLFAGVKVFDLRLSNVPTALSVTILPAALGGTVVFDAKGQTLGKLEIRATGFIPEFAPPGTLDQDLNQFIGAIPSGFALAGTPADGFVLKKGDPPPGNPIFFVARLSGFKKANVTGDPNPNISVDLTGRKYFKFDIAKFDASKPPSRQLYFRGFLDSLKPLMKIRIEPHNTGQRIFYEAAESPKILSIDTNAGNRANLHAELGTRSGTPPVPRQLTICQASDSACTGTGELANKGSLSFDPSERTILNLFDCQSPLTNCTASTATKSITVTNLRVKRVAEEVHLTGTPTGAGGHFFFDTTPGCCVASKANLNATENGVSGDVKIQLPDSPDVFISFPVVPDAQRVVADNRLQGWQTTFGFVSSTRRTGFINCPPGTKVELFGFLPITGLLCAGTFTLTPAKATVAAGERVNFALDWVHPVNWRELTTLELRIRGGEDSRDDDGDDVILWVLVDLRANTVCLLKSSGNPRCGTPGSAARLQTDWARLFLSDTKIVGSGPEGKSVNVTLPVAFKPKAAGETYQVEVAASDESANQLLEPAGTVTVMGRGR